MLSIAKESGKKTLSVATWNIAAINNNVSSVILTFLL